MSARPEKDQTMRRTQLAIRLALALGLLLPLAGCGSGSADAQDAGARPAAGGPAEADPRSPEAAAAEDAAADATAEHGAAEAPGHAPFDVTPVAEFHEPWAMARLPDGRLLVTEKRGALVLFDPESAQRIEVSGVPAVDYGGQGGLGDVALHPDFADNRIVYLSYAEAGEGNRRGAAVTRARLVVEGDGARLEQPEVIYRQVPKLSGRGHYAHRLLFGPDGHLWISNGDRQEFDPAQDMRSNLGKIVRLDDKGNVPADNPFADKGGVTAQIWSLGHRNPLGIAFDGEGRLWDVEMGPAGGDELNLVQRGGNYGYPVVSNGDHYDGREIPDHGSAADTGFIAPAITWTPVISPSSMVFYRGQAFPDWQGDALIGALSGQALVRVEVDGERAREVARYPMDQRIRGVLEAADGSLWLLEDEREGKGGRLLRLSPKH